MTGGEHCGIPSGFVVGVVRLLGGCLINLCWIRLHPKMRDVRSHYKIILLLVALIATQQNIIKSWYLKLE